MARKSNFTECKLCATIVSKSTRGMCLKCYHRMWRLIPSNAERVRARTRAWGKANPERKKANNLADYEAKKAYYYGLSRARALANPELQRIYKKNSAHKRRASKKAPTCNVTVKAWKDRVEVFGNRCAYCGNGDTKLTMDHVIPLSRGGMHILSNLRPACLSCNSRKHARKLSEWKR